MNDDVRRALERLSHVRDFEIFMDYLKARQADAAGCALTAIEKPLIYRAQGRYSEVTEIIKGCRPKPAPKQKVTTSF